ncbi:MAG: hypothetical protein H6541_05875 [Lentimicrobiaceae bacterium]|nr:hypothetical protein [Lentimicrobiaceae bacterium]MCB9023373.1 hypothetical protein [Lentimicrobiaceae bacterium]MCO5266169.1 hypothetical protein [Lentimicrobium sp.]
MKIVAFKVRKAKQFNYKPLFYDQKKDEMEERLKRYTQKEEAEGERLRSRLRESWKVREARNNLISKRTLYIYLLVAFAIIYLVFFY